MLHLNLTIKRTRKKLNLFLVKKLPFGVTWALSLFIVSFPIFNPDLYWHLANGRAMVAARHIINEDVMSFTHFGDHFINHEWLSQILFFLFWDRLGPEGLFGFKILLSSLVIFFIYRSALLEGGRPWVAAQLCVLAVLAGIQRYHIRPELFTLLNLAILGYVLHSFRLRPSHSHRLLVIPLIFLTWDWLHGAIIGLVYLFIFTAAENLKAVFPALGNTFPSNTRGLKKLNICFALTAGVVVINPYGLLSYGHFVVLATGLQGADRIIELQPMWQAVGEFFPFIFLFIWAMVMLIVFRRTSDITDTVLIVVFGAGALAYNRLAGVAAIVLVPALARHISVGFGKNSRGVSRGISITGLGIAAAITVIIGFDEKIIKMSGTISPQGTYTLPSETAFGFSVNELFTPAGSVRFIKETGLKGNMYNNANLGGYLSFYLAPDRRIFQYNMPPVFGDVTRFVRNPKKLAPWKVEYALAGSAGELSRLFPSSEWAWVYSDYVSTLVVKRKPKYQSLIDKYEIHYFSPEQSLRDFQTLAKDSRVYPRLAFEMGVYLQYITDKRIADRWGRLLLKHPDLMNHPPVQDLINKATDRNNILESILFP